MKMKPKAKPSVKPAKVSVSPPVCEVTRSNGVAVLTVHQAVKQSRNYQSAECGYSVQVTVLDSDAAIRKGFLRAEFLIETALTDKVAEQTKRLEGVSE